jgi:ADP-heptose:LPS heptosyltransferase
VRYKEWEHVRRVLAVRLEGVGSVVTLGPSLRVLKGALPKAQVALLASPSGSQVVPLLPWVDDLLVHDPIWQDTSAEPLIDVEAQVELVELIESRRFDVAIVFTSRQRSPWPAAYVCYLAGVPIRLGQSRELGGGLLTHWVRPLPDDAHPVDRELYLLESSGLPVAGRQLELHIPDPARVTAANLIEALGFLPEEPYAVLAPEPVASRRRYPAGAYAELCRDLARRAGLPVVIVGGGGDAPMADQIAAGAGSAPVASVAGKTSVPELAAIVESATLVITGSAATMQVADALRRPMVVLAAADEPAAHWRPRAAVARLLRAKTYLEIPPTVVTEEALTVLEAPTQRDAPDPSGRLALSPPDAEQPRNELDDELE